MRILVTGCSGYIASKLIPRLREKQHELMGIDRVAYWGSDLDRFIRADLRNSDLYEKELEGVDYVCHLAAAKGDWGISQAEYFRDNVDASRELLQVGQAKGITKWFFYSTVSVLGPSATPKDEAAGFDPINPYGTSKAEAEKLFQCFVQENDQARVIVLRPSVVYGPDNPESTNVFRLIDGVYRGRFLMIGNGSAVKTTSYIDNVVSATLFLLDQTAAGLRTYHYVDEPRISTGELVRKIHELLNKPLPGWYVPLAIVRPVAWLSDIAGSITQIDFPITKARIEKFCTSTNFEANAIRALGFTQPVSNCDALKATVSWFMDQIENAPNPSVGRYRALPNRKGARQ